MNHVSLCEASYRFVNFSLSFKFIWFISGLTFISFFLLTLGLISSYSNSLSSKVNILRFSYFLIFVIYCCEPLSYNCFSSIPQILVFCISIFVCIKIFFFDFSYDSFFGTPVACCLIIFLWTYQFYFHNWFLVLYHCSWKWLLFFQSYIC